MQPCRVRRRCRCGGMGLGMGLGIITATGSCMCLGQLRCLLYLARDKRLGAEAGWTSGARWVRLGGWGAGQVLDPRGSHHSRSRHAATCSATVSSAAAGVCGWLRLAASLHSLCNLARLVGCEAYMRGPAGRPGSCRRDWGPRRMAAARRGQAARVVRACAR